MMMRRTFTEPYFAAGSSPLYTLPYGGGGDKVRLSRSTVFLLTLLALCAFLISNLGVYYLTMITCERNRIAAIDAAIRDVGDSALVWGGPSKQLRSTIPPPTIKTQSSTMMHLARNRLTVTDHTTTVVTTTTNTTRRVWTKPPTPRPIGSVRPADLTTRYHNPSLDRNIIIPTIIESPSRSRIVPPTADEGDIPVLTLTANIMTVNEEKKQRGRTDGVVNSLERSGDSNYDLRNFIFYRKSSTTSAPNE